MKLLLAILLPPVAVIMCGRPWSAMVNLLLTVLLYFPGAIHALFVVMSYEADQRQARLVRQIAYEMQRNQ